MLSSAAASIAVAAPSCSLDNLSPPPQQPCRRRRPSLCKSGLMMSEPVDPERELEDRCKAPEYQGKYFFNIATLLGSKFDPIHYHQRRRCSSLLNVLR